MQVNLACHKVEGNGTTWVGRAQLLRKPAYEVYMKTQLDPVSHTLHDTYCAKVIEMTKNVPEHI